MTNDQTMLFKRLIEYAHMQAMMRNGQIAQDIRLALNDARRYWHLRDVSDPDTCRYYLASDDPASAFNNPAHVDKQIDADRANVAERDALRADAERWRNIRDHMDTLVKERDSLRAELDRISART